MSFLGALGSTAVNLGAGLLGSAIGGGSSKVPFGQTAVDINSGGLTSKSFKGDVNLSSSPERQGIVGNIQRSFGDLSGELAALRGSVAPGFSDLRKSRLQAVENARLNAIGNLRDNLARRKVLGSSFGQDAITRAEAEFGQVQDRVEAETFLQELALTQDLIQKQYTAERAQFETGLNELNFQTEVGLKLAGKASDAYSAMTNTSMKLDAAAAEGAGKFAGSIAAPLAKAAGGIDVGGVDLGALMG